VNYTLHFGQVVGYLPYLLGGAWLSIQIAFLAFVGGLLIGTAGAAARTFGGPVVAGLVGAYVTFMTNTPQLVQIYLIFFALPDAGILLSPYQAVLLGMTVNAGAYLTEIERAGFASAHPSELEAAETLGMNRWQSIRYVILPHVARVLFPPISNQLILMILGSSMAAVFGVEELTGRALNSNATSFRSIEIFSLTGVLYVAITIIATAALAVAGRYFFRARVRVF
jgi:polar amino acid transport system permease protein